MIVMKFGGTSVGTVDAIRQTISILIERTRMTTETPPVAIVSAMGGVTNLLLSSAKDAANGNALAGNELRRTLLDRHVDAIERLVTQESIRLDAEMRIAELIERCCRLIDSVHVLRDLSPRAQDWIVSFGERMSSVLVAAAIQDSGFDATSIPADELIVTDDSFGNASPLLDATRQKASQRIAPLLEQGTIPIVTGYFGATEYGVVATLGRGGSDFSATILGNALNADEVWIWTDVDGVMSADPRIVSSARTLPSITFAEAAELAYFGAKVIHPRTVQPAIERGIPIWIKNTFNPQFPGTRISLDSTGTGSAKAITAIPGISVISIEGSGFLSVATMTSRVFGTLGRAGYNVYMISQASSQHSLSFAVDRESSDDIVELLHEEFELDLFRQRLLRIWDDKDMAIIAVVGAGMRGTPGVAGLVFKTLGDHRINILTIAQGSSELNISCVIAESAIPQAVPALHEAFTLGTEPPAV